MEGALKALQAEGRFCAAWRAQAARDALEATPPRLPPLADLTRQSQLHGPRRRFRVAHLHSGGSGNGAGEGDAGADGGEKGAGAHAGDSDTLAVPLLFASLARNDADGEARVRALGCEWLVPRHSAFSLSRLESWRQIARSGVLPQRGYQLLLLDPPWPSRSVRHDTYLYI